MGSPRVTVNAGGWLLCSRMDALGQNAPVLTSSSQLEFSKAITWLIKILLELSVRCTYTVFIGKTFKRDCRGQIITS